MDKFVKLVSNENSFGLLVPIVGTIEDGRFVPSDEMPPERSWFYFRVGEVPEGTIFDLRQWIVEAAQFAWAEFEALLRANSELALSWATDTASSSPVGQTVIEAARFATSPEGRKKGSGAMGQLKEAVAAYNEAQAGLLNDEPGYS
jgi:hypothetical protein